MDLLLRTYLEIAMLRRGPDVLPRSGFLLFTTVIIYTVLSMTFTSIVGFDGERAATLVALDLLLITGFFGAVLAIANRAHRLPQTLEALFGVGIFFMILTLPFAFLQKVDEGADALMTIAALLYLGVAVWNIVAYGHIVQRAIDRSQAFGIAIAILHFVIAHGLSRLLIQEAT